MADLETAEAMCMILVKLYRREASLMTEGCLGEPHPGQVRLQPAGIATASEIRAISHALSRNEVRGQVGRYEWRAE